MMMTTKMKEEEDKKEEKVDQGATIVFDDSVDKFMRPRMVGSGGGGEEWQTE